MFINVGEITTLSSTETFETTSAYEHTVQNQATSEGKTVIN